MKLKDYCYGGIQEVSSLKMSNFLPPLPPSLFVPVYFTYISLYVYLF